MASIVDAFALAFRDYVTANVPASGAHDPDKGEIRALGPLIESAIANAALAGLVDVIKATQADLNADLAHPAGTVALVYGDPDDSKTDLYVKAGASGAGNWTNTGALHSTVEGLVSPLLDAIKGEGNTIYTPLTRQRNVASVPFRTYYDRFYGLHIQVPTDLNGADSPRLYVTRIGVRSNDPADANFVGLTISRLKPDATFEPVAECYEWGSAGTPGGLDNTTFVDGQLVGLGAYAGRVFGKIRMERTTAWNYFFAGGNNANQIARTYTAGAPSNDDFEIDPAFVERSDVGAALQPAYSVFTPTAFKQNLDDALFLDKIDTLYDLEIELSRSLDDKQYKRLFVTAIGTEFNAINLPTVEISYLTPDNDMVLIATAHSTDDAVTPGQFDGGNTFVEYDLRPAPGYGGLISGRFRWLRPEGWNYFYNNNVPVTWENDAAALGALEISQNHITYVGGTGALVYPDTPTYSQLWERMPKFADRYLKGQADVTLVVLGDSINTANGYATGRADAAMRPPLCHQNTLFSFVEERLRWRGQQYRRFDAAGVFTEAATSRETKDYDGAWDWQPPTAIVPNSQANFKQAITRVLNGGPASVSYSFPAGMRRCDFIYRTDYLCAALTTVTIAGGNGRVQAFDEASGNWVEANGYAFSTKEADAVTTYDIVDPYGNYDDQPLRKSMYQKRLKMRSLADLTAKVVTLTNNGAGRLNYWGIEYSPRPVMFRAVNSSRGGHNISRLRAFEAWDLDYWAPDLIWLNNMVINEGAGSLANMPAANRPADFAGRFAAYAAALQAKPYDPDLLTSTIFIGSGAQMVDQGTGAFNEGTVAGFGPANVFDYIGALDRAYADADVPHVNMFYEFLDVAERKATIAGTGNIWTAALAGSSAAGATLTIDGTHLNDYGNEVARRLFLPAFKRLY